MVEPEPLILCMENMSGEEVELKIELHDTFQDFLEKAKLLLGYDVDINSITGNQPVSLDANIYNFLLKAEQHFEGTTLSPENFDEMSEHNETDDLVYILDDGTQIRASQIQFDNDDPLVDITSEQIPFVKYKDDSNEENDEIDDTNVTIKNINITDSPVASWSNKESPKCSFANSLPFNLVCNNILNFEAQFTKYLESSAKTYTDLNNITKNKSPGSAIGENYKNYDSKNDGFFTREDVLNMFKDAPVTPLPYEDNQTEKRKHVRKTDPARVVYKNWNAKPITEVGSGLEKQNCFICCEIVKNSEKLYLFDKEDQMLHRCEQRKYNMQLKIICDKCLSENFKPSRIKSPTQSLDDNEYLVIKNNQQFIFQKSSNINLKSSYFINNINMNNINNTEKIDKINKTTRNRESVEFVKVEIGPDGEIVTKPIDNDVKYDDVVIVKDKKDSSSDVEIIEPDVNEQDVEIDVDNFEDADEHVKEFLGKYQRNFENTEFKCRFCKKNFEKLEQAVEHCDVHKHELDDGIVFPCPLCDYGYENSKWLKAHLNAAHDNMNKDKSKEENTIKKENSQNKEDGVDKIIENSEDVKDENSPVAKRTRSSLKKNEEDINNGTPVTLRSKESESQMVDLQNTSINIKVEVKQEDSSDSDSIWIVHTGDDDDEQLKKLLQVTEAKRDVNDLKRHKCFTCSQIFPNAESLRTHKCRKRIGKRQYNLAKKESLLLSPTREEFNKKRKKKTREPNDPQIVTCHNCNESFTSKVRLKFHMQFHEATNLLTSDGQYVCADCKDITFPNETKLFDHVHFQHNKQKRWQCPVKDCGKTFFLRATLTKHSRMHTDTRRYVCVTCGKRFLDKQTLDEHGVTHLQIKPFQCHICLKQLTRRSRLRMHLRAHEEELSPALVLVCAMCSRAFRDHVDAQEHAAKSTECIDEFANDLKEEATSTEQLSPTSGIVRHTVLVTETRGKTSIPKEVNTEESETLLAALDDVARNIIRVVDIEKAFRCEYCEDVFYLEDALNNHRLLHKGVKNPFTCHICKVSFATYSRCTTHKTTHGFYKRSATEASTEGRAGPASAGILGYGGFPVVKHFLCEDCGRSYLHWTYFQVHRRMKHANENYIFKCNQCEMTFPNSWSATYHRKKVHSKNSQDANGGFTKIVRENYRIPCRDCDEVLPNKIALYKHRQKEHCDATLMDKEDEWSELEEADTTVCNKCGLDLHNVVSLGQHDKDVHGCSSEVRTSAHSCPVCARSFRSASMRDEHVRVHTGERPFPCDVCGVAFRRSTAMRNHRLLHTGARPWGCAHCPKRFRVKSDLRTHVRLKHPAHLAVIEVEGRSCTQEEVLQHLDNNNISRDKVIEITMITFPQNTTNIVPNTVRALSMLSDFPRTVIPCDWKTRVISLGQSQETLQPPPRRGRGIDKNPRRAAILQRCDDLPQTSQDTSTYVQNEGENIPTLDVQLLLQNGTLLNKSQVIQVNDGILLEQSTTNTAE